MKKMDKNKEQRGIGSEDFRRYRNGEMTGEERNAFEKELQKDPFLEEASEGFSIITGEQVEEDLKALSKKLGKRTGIRSAAIYYRIAAAVAVLVTVSVIFFNRNRETDFMVSKSETVMTDTPVSIAAAEPIKDLSEKAESKKEPAKRSQQISPLSPLSPSPAPPVSPSPIPADTEQPVLSADDKADTKDLVKEEVLTVGIGQDLARAAKGRFVSEHATPQPIAGIDSFNIYIEENMKSPGTRGEQIVIISFIVNTDSTLSDFRIIESPGQSFSREAKRLIKEGPRWIPAIDNGLHVKEETRIKIVFR
jgi:hypothetical protein